MFVGRSDEQGEFIRWVENESSGGTLRRAALVIGSAGMGKSALLEKFADLCRNRAPETWHVQLARLNSNESASSFLERLLVEAHSLLKGSYLRVGPYDERIKTGLLKAVPKLGDLLALLVKDDKRPGWQRFVGYLSAISDALDGSNGRFILLIDPDRAMQEGQTADWHSIAKRLPPRTRVVIAQRPDDVIAADPESKLIFEKIPSSGSLSELGEKRIDQLYEYEFDLGRLRQPAAGWASDVRSKLPIAAYRRYGGYPFAHDAAIRLLLTQSVHDPVTAIAEWPRDVAELLDMLFKSLSGQGEERHRAALALQVFAMPTPLSIWAKAANLEEAALARCLDDSRYAHFFTQEQTNVYAPFHQLFAERLERELMRLRETRVQLADAAWKAIEPELDPQKLATSIPDEFALLASTRVAARFEAVERVLEAFNRVAFVKERLGLLDAAFADQAFVLYRYGEAHSSIRACAYCNIGNLLFTRGDLDGAEARYREALEINENLNWQEGMASALGSLGNVLKTRGDLDGAKSMYRKALEIEEKLGRLAEMAKAYGNLGNVLRTRGDLAGAEVMYRKALEINEEQGRLEGIAIAYGNLGNVLATRGDLAGAEAMYRKSLEIEEKLGRLEGIASNYGNLGNVLATRGDLDDAEVMYRKALEIEEKLGRLEGMANAYGNLGNLLEARGDLDGAEAMFRKSLENEERLGRPEGMANAFANLGNVLMTRGDLDGAEAMHHKALEINKKLGRPEGMATGYGNLGNVLITRGDLVGAESMYRKALEIDERLGRLEGMANAFGNLGIVLQIRGDLGGAEAMYRKVLEIEEQLGRLEGIANAYGNLGILLQARGDLAGGERMYRKALEINERLGRPEGIAKSHANLGRLYAEHGNKARV